MSDPELIQQARAEAQAIIAEAEEQARRLMEVAQDRRTQAFGENEEIRRQGQKLARNLERSIQLLTQILEELKRQTG